MEDRYSRKDDSPKVKLDVGSDTQARDMTPISYKWVYKAKTCLDASVERYKTLLMACNFSQQYVMDYDETFSLVVQVLITLITFKL